MMTNKQQTSKSKPDNGVKKFTRFISRSSQRFLASFIDEETEHKKYMDRLYQQINQAIAQKSTVVLHYHDETIHSQPDDFDTLLGRLYQHSVNPDSLVIKLQHTNEVRMISAKHIKKLSIIKPRYHQQISANK